MESRGSISHTQGLSINPYPELVLIPISLKSILILSFHIRLGLSKGIFPVGLPVKILKALLPSSVLATDNRLQNIIYE